MNFISKPSFLRRVCPQTFRMSAAFSTDGLRVDHNEAQQKFCIKLGKDEAVLEYEKIDSGTLDLVHTFVPQALRSHGVAKLLAKEAFSYVIDNNLKAKVTCTYLQKFMRENPPSKPEKFIVN